MKPMPPGAEFVPYGDIPALRAWYDRLLGLPIYREHIARPLV